MIPQKRAMLILRETNTVIITITGGISDNQVIAMIGSFANRYSCSRYGCQNLQKNNNIKWNRINYIEMPQRGFVIGFWCIVLN